LNLNYASKQQWVFGPFHNGKFLSKVTAESLFSKGLLWKVSTFTLESYFRKFYVNNAAVVTQTQWQTIHIAMMKLFCLQEYYWLLQIINEEKESHSVWTTSWIEKKPRLAYIHRFNGARCCRCCSTISQMDTVLFNLLLSKLKPLIERQDT